MMAMAPAETLAAAAALIREQHGESCPDRLFWAATADLLDESSRAYLRDTGTRDRIRRAEAAGLPVRKVKA